MPNRVKDNRANRRKYFSLLVIQIGFCYNFLVFKSKALIVEGEDIFALDLQRILAAAGYEIVGTAHNGEEAVALAEANQPDIVLLDIRLQGKLDGVQTADLLNARFDIPIIYLTSQVGDTTLRRSKMTEPFGYLFKPFDEKILFTTIEVAIHHHKMQKKLKESEQWLNIILTSVGDGLIAVDEEDRVQFINPVSTRLTGWTEEDAIDQNLTLVYKIIDEITLQPVDCTRQAVQSPPKTHQQILLVRRDGQTTPIEAIIAPIQSELGEVRGRVIAFRDISERRKAFQEIRRQASRSEALARVAARVNSKLNLQAVLETICKETATVLEMPASGVFLLNEPRGIFQSAAFYSQNEAGLTGYREMYTEIPADILLNILGADKPVVHIPDLSLLKDLPIAQELAQQNFRTIAIAPLFMDTKIIGTLMIISVERVFPLAQEDLDFLRGLADHSGIAIANARLFEQIRAGRERMQSLSRRLVDVQEAERRLLAGELHDQVGQVLTGMQYSIESTKRLSGEALKTSLEEMQGVVKDLMAQIREMALILRPSMLDDMGLLPTLLWHFDRYTKQTGIQVDFTHFGLDNRLASEIETAIYRIVQEALTNVARYARVNQVDVRVINDDEMIRVQVWDQGAGFDPATLNKQSFGVNGMRERAYSLGGRFDIHSAPGEGTQVVAYFPQGKQLERRKNARNSDRGR
jgi:PAS domain S-box-containing protein